MNADEYFCGCEGRVTTTCRCMAGYTLPQRLSEASRDVVMFCLGGVVAAIVVFGMMV